MHCVRINCYKQKAPSQLPKRFACIFSNQMLSNVATVLEKFSPASKAGNFNIRTGNHSDRRLRTHKWKEKGACFLVFQYDRRLNLTSK